jgi:hypothetical protein
MRLAAQGGTAHALLTPHQSPSWSAFSMLGQPETASKLALLKSYWERRL